MGIKKRKSKPRGDKMKTKINENLNEIPEIVKKSAPARIAKATVAFLKAEKKLQ